MPFHGESCYMSSRGSCLPKFRQSLYRKFLTQNCSFSLNKCIIMRCLRIMNCAIPRLKSLKQSHDQCTDSSRGTSLDTTAKKLFVKPSSCSAETCVVCLVMIALCRVVFQLEWMSPSSAICLQRRSRPSYPEQYG